MDCNPSFARIFGFAGPDEVLQTSIDDIFPPDVRSAYLQALRRERRLELHELTLRRRDGSDVHVVGNYIGLFDDAGELIEVHGYLFDITERKRLEARLAQAQRLEVIGRLAGGLAHEFNNLLTVIRGNTQLALMNGAAGASAVLGHLEEIDRAAGRAGQLTRQLLAFGRRQLLQPRPLEVPAILDDLRTALEGLAGEDVRLTMESAADLWPVRADVDQLREAVVTLVVHARAAVSAGGAVAVTARNRVVGPGDRRADPLLAPGDYVELQVRHDGSPLPPDVQDHIWEPFFPATGNGRGAGLALSTVYGFVRQSGGFVWAENVQGGATFCVLLPRVHDAAADSTAAAPLREQPRGTETVVVVEDEEAVRSVVVQVLRSRGYRVLHAASGEEALGLAARYSGRIHLLVTDVILTGMDGVALARDFTRDRADTQVLLMSGYTADVAVDLGISDGAHFLQKPFTPAELLEKVRALLG